MLNGWICFHRKTLKHWVMEEPESIAVWVRMLLEANHDEQKKVFNGSLVTISRGQLIYGRKAFSAKSGVSEAKLRRIVSLLETDGMISQQKTNKYSIISITNYSQYQDINQQNTSESPADNQQIASKSPHLNNNNNTNNGNNNNNGDKSPKKITYKDLDYSSWPNLPDKQILADWMEVRRKKKASNTQTAINGIGKQLHLAAKKGFSIDQCIEEAVTRSWSGFKAEWMDNANVIPAKPQRQIKHASDMPFPTG